MLGHRCRGVFNTFYVTESKAQDLPVGKADLASAFEQGTLAAQQGAGIGACPYGVQNDSSKFMAWLAGYRCCSK
ncbi:ribosome modulation factor [Pararhizobium arenae]|uniref:ribosome modulation factor n=1 Tax=Pararhizobium arenae TaxID=1856850 RepID=UPI00094B34E4